MEGREGRFATCNFQVVSPLSVLAQPCHRCQRTATCSAQANRKWLVPGLYLHPWAGLHAAALWKAGMYARDYGLLCSGAPLVLEGHQY